MDEERMLRKVKSISSLDELDGYESEAKIRGIHPAEMRALHEKRIQLTPKKRKHRCGLFSASYA